MSVAKTMTMFNIGPIVEALSFWNLLG